ncbi:MAG: hypothetical protein GY838_13295 [bacterium]|nr:hypothetical protein [bacterium]
MTPAPGIYFNVPFVDYLKWDALSKSGLGHLAESPAQYRHWLSVRDDFIPTDPMIVGSAVDVLIFDGLAEFHSQFFRLPVGVKRSPGTMKFTIELLRNGDKIALPVKMWDRVFAIADAVQSAPEVAEILARSRSQVSFLWEEPKTKLLLKGRLDLWDPPCIWDLKVTGDITPRGWRRQVFRLNQDWQAGLYCEALTYLTGEVHDQWGWITARDQPAHGVQIYDLKQNDLVEAWIMIAEHLETFKVCNDNNAWPANSGTRQTISLNRSSR